MATPGMTLLATNSICTLSCVTTKGRRSASNPWPAPACRRNRVKALSRNARECEAFALTRLRWHATFAREPDAVGSARLSPRGRLQMSSDRWRRPSADRDRQAPGRQATPCWCLSRPSRSKAASATPTRCCAYASAPCGADAGGVVASPRRHLGPRRRVRPSERPGCGRRGCGRGPGLVPGTRDR